MIYKTPIKKMGEIFEISMLRSFKVVQMFMNTKNFKFISESNKKMLDMLCKIKNIYQKIRKIFFPNLLVYKIIFFNFLSQINK